MVLRVGGELAMPSFVCRLRCRSPPASTSAASRAMGTPQMPNPAPVLRNASAAVGVTVPKACCQASYTRGTSSMPFGMSWLLAQRAPRVE